jgi:hypothetical protein
MQDSADKLTPKQLTALAALLAGRSVETAAQEAKVNPATVHRWLNEPDFQAAQRAGRRDLASVALAQLQEITGVAVGVIRELMEDASKPASVRLRAAQIVIESSVKWLEIDTDTRLAAL